MNLQHLKYAVTVAEFHSINKAADALYISQPNLSRAIRELEQEIGITIFKRTPQGVSLTFSGEEFLFHARAILNEVEQIQRISEGGTTIQRFWLSWTAPGECWWITRRPIPSAFCRAY